MAKYRRKGNFKKSSFRKGKGRKKSRKVYVTVSRGGIRL